MTTIPLRLSKSQLDKFQSCARCFWLKHRAGVDQPDMISSKVWKGVERITQGYYDEHRAAKTTPLHLVGQRGVPEGSIPYQEGRIDLKSLRYWGKGLAFEVDGVRVTTALDDMLQVADTAVEGGIRYIVDDYKSKSKPTDEEATAELYQNQADVFDYACNVNGYPTDGVVIFDYWSPARVEGAEPPSPVDPFGHTVQRWVGQVVPLKANHERMKAIVRAAAACLESRIPEPSVKITKGPRGGTKVEGCPVCAYTLDLARALKDVEAAEAAVAAGAPK